ncbi:hypothetical protein KLVA111870_13000 [Klebsiella variicola]|nr:hypothetical protein SB5610_00920 [Klebsiella variicola]VGQ07563.1 hypothetical protein SB5387_04742 [Klebsiella variicola]
MITHLSYLFLPGVTPSGIRSEFAFCGNEKQYFINIVIMKFIYSDKNAFSLARLPVEIPVADKK